MCLYGRSLPGEKLWEAELAMNCMFPEQDTLLSMVKISASVSTKSHSIIAYPNASGCVTITAPGSGTKSGDLNNMSKVSDLRRKSVNIKSYHIVKKTLTYIEASLSNRVEIAIGYKVKEGTLRGIEDEIFSIDNVEAFEFCG